MSLIKPIARLVVRANNDNDGLIIGTRMKTGRDSLSTGVYEIREILGETTVVRIGDWNQLDIWRKPPEGVFTGSWDSLTENQKTLWNKLASKLTPEFLNEF